MTTVFVVFALLGLAGMPLFIRMFDEEGKRSRREQERKTALTVHVARRVHGTGT